MNFPFPHVAIQCGPSKVQLVIPLRLFPLHIETKERIEEMGYKGRVFMECPYPYATGCALIEILATQKEILDIALTLFPDLDTLL